MNNLYVSEHLPQSLNFLRNDRGFEKIQQLLLRLDEVIE